MSEEVKEELTEEKKAELETLAEQIVIKAEKTHLWNIRQYLDRKGITIHDAIQEVWDKKSGLPANSRRVLTTIRKEYLYKWFDENRD